MYSQFIKAALAATMAATLAATLAAPIAAEPTKGSAQQTIEQSGQQATQPNTQPTDQPAQVLLASSEIRTPGQQTEGQVAAPAKRPRAARVTSCRCAGQTSPQH